FTVYGTPSKTGNWGWRVEGHHLSLSFTLAGTQIASTTPNFYGANPANFKSGPKGNVRVLAATETLALDLFKSLDDDQKKTAWRDKPFGEPKSRSADSGVSDPVGLPGSAMTAAQKKTLSE